MRIQWTLIFALIFALIIALFAVVNVAPVPVNFIFATRSIPLILVVLGSTLIGGLIVGLFGIIRQYRLQRSIRGLQKQLAERDSKEPVETGSTAAPIDEADIAKDAASTNKADADDQPQPEASSDTDTSKSS